MAKIPRDISGERLSGLLNKFGYVVVRQTSSHVRLRSTLKSTEHKITIPRHQSIKIGTLNHILNDISQYLKISKKELIEELFGEG
jgi:predicted RNA binding protein YcfA (HicA-like mRNA interferase family)